jgi:hypothetical protein
MTIRIETGGDYGSVWEIDELDMRYRRWPKNEGPRPSEYSSDNGGPLKDFVWHTMSGWRVDEHWLRIYNPDGMTDYQGRGGKSRIKAPYPK